MKIAYCNAIRQFHGNQLADLDWCSRFPGTAWVGVLHAWSVGGPFEIASGDVAIDLVRRGEWKASDVHVLQELDAPHGLELCRMGSRPTLLMSLESPLVAFRNFDRLRRRVAPFAHVMGPAPLYSDRLVGRGAQAHALTFPSFWRHRASADPITPRTAGVVLVAANKYWRERPPHGWRDVRGSLRSMRRDIRRFLSRTFNACARHQLHDERLAVIEALSRRGALDLWGPGWDRLSNLPSAWQARMERCELRRHGACDDKAAVLARFEFALAFENTACPGYVTEKIFDAMCAGCIPIYRGAPDVQAHVPAEAFLDGRGLSAARDPVAWIRERIDGRADTMREAARAFLRTPTGLRHSFEGFASWVLELCGVAVGERP